ncbi:thioredoxin domain-containing protein [Candidatus Methylocalor cossyra]|uniref:Thymidylate kinase n=1 Tax=Candidatus Methylocalor cossyra TaxID=3108543 RepID=A0ABM9NM88_9GAMM
MHPSHRNRLSAETSPYLQQHADNPVDWYPWGQEALDKARREDKPILLSIGYSACHWCHVMAHESFEDPDTARVMNELFVNVKVDREERPDLDKVYQLAHQIIARRPGGWPLTVFLNPHNQLPFFTGTYFPKTARYQLPDFVTVLHKVAEHYRQQKDELRRHDQALAGILKAIQREGPADAPDPRLLAAARQALDSEFDAVHGGFGGAPKFPQASNLELLLYLTRLDETGDPGALHMATESLAKMAEGGLFDQIGGGFYRYSVDSGWQIPHFEKMLYDNAVLLRLYAEAWQLTGRALFRRVAEATAEWVLREMRAPEGGFYSALDADSEGEEGKYYLWDRAEVRALLDPDEYALVERHYGLDQTPNFEARWHLHVERPLPEVAQGLGLDPGAAEQRLAAARAKLYAARQRRVRPGLDDKRLTAWNALMIKGLAAAGRRLGRDEYIAAAETAFAFLRRSAVDADGHLLATYKGGEARLKAYLDDYAFLLDAGLELLQCRWRSDDLGWLLNLADQLLSRFEDRERGGFFFTAEDHEPLIQRPKSLADESLPAGNGVAALALLRLGQLVGEPRYSEAAERALKAAVPVLRQFPHGHGALLLALAEWLHPAELVILRGRPEGLGPWLAAARRGDRRRLVFAIPNDAGELPGDLAARRAEDGEVAYLCTGTSCLPPIRSMEELVRSPR